MAGEMLVNSVLIFLPVVILSATFVVMFSAALAIVEGLQTFINRLGGENKS